MFLKHLVPASSNDVLERESDEDGANR